MLLCEMGREACGINVSCIVPWCASFCAVFLLLWGLCVLSSEGLLCCCAKWLMKHVVLFIAVWCSSFCAACVFMGIAKGIHDLL